MTRRSTEPKQELELTGATNRQSFPARVEDDAAQEDNRKRVQAVKEADLERQTLPPEREALNAETVTVTGSGGTKVRTTKDSADALKASGFTGK